MLLKKKNRRGAQDLLLWFIIHMSKRGEQCDPPIRRELLHSLTVFGDPESLGLVFADAKQHNGGVEGRSDFCLLQQVINQLDLPPAGTQQHGNGLHTNTSTREAHIQKSERHTPKQIDVSETRHGLPHGSPA